LEGPCRILVLGYSWFGPYTHNPAAEVAELLDGARLGGCSIHGEALRVSAGEVLSKVPRLLEELDPRAVVGLGLNPRATKVTLELAAVNILHSSTPDVDGRRYRLREIVGGGPLAVAAPAPIEAIYKHCNEERLLPLQVGVSIGTYLCNTLAYLIYSWAQEKGRPAAFLHVPPHSSLAMRLGMPIHASLRDIVETTLCVIERLIG